MTSWSALLPGEGRTWCSHKLSLCAGTILLRSKWETTATTPTVTTATTDNTDSNNSNNWQHWHRDHQPYRQHQYIYPVTPIVTTVTIGPTSVCTRTPTVTAAATGNRNYGANISITIPALFWRGAGRQAGGAVVNTRWHWGHDGSLRFVVWTEPSQTKPSHLWFGLNLYTPGLDWTFTLLVWAKPSRSWFGLNLHKLNLHAPGLGWTFTLLVWTEPSRSWFGGTRQHAGARLVIWNEHSDLWLYWELKVCDLNWKLKFVVKLNTRVCDLTELNTYQACGWT